jgi:hypothetical protein
VEVQAVCSWTLVLDGGEKLDARSGHFTLFMQLNTEHSDLSRIRCKVVCVYTSALGQVCEHEHNTGKNYYICSVCEHQHQ